MAITRYNPFVFGPPVQDPAYFFGRDQELTVIMNTIGHMAPGLRQSMAVMGPRRIGKSSLLYQIINRLHSSNNIIALISTEQFVPRSPLVLTQGILQSFREAIESKDDHIPQVAFDLLDKPAPPEHMVFTRFRQDLKRFNHALANAQFPPAILMIDEVEGLLDFGGLQVLGIFRDLAQTLPYVMFVVAGSDRLYDLINDNTSPFFNVFKTITIKPLSNEDTAMMIRESAEKVYLNFNGSAISKVVQISGGIPYLVNMICHYATEIVLTEKLPVVTQKEIDAACRTIPNQVEGYFLDIWGRVQGLEKVVLYVLATANKPQSLTKIAADVSAVDISQPISQIRDLLKELVQRQVIKQDADDRYSFINQLMPIWLHKNRIASQVVKEAQAPIVSTTSENVNAKRERLEQELQKYQGNLHFFEEQLSVSGSSATLVDQINLLRNRITIVKQTIQDLDNVQIIEPKSITPPQTNLRHLRDILTTYFNESELRDLCFDLNIDYDNIPGRGKADKARELIVYAQRHNILDELLLAGQRLRPSVNWL